VILQTGGSAVGEISTRSRPFSRAIRTASYGCMTPSWPPSSSITRTSRARIRSFTRVRSLCCRKLRSAIFPPNKFKAPDTRLAGYCPDSKSCAVAARTTRARHYCDKSVRDGLQSIARRQLATARVRCPAVELVAKNSRRRMGDFKPVTLAAAVCRDAVAGLYVSVLGKDPASRSDGPRR